MTDDEIEKWREAQRDKADRARRFTELEERAAMSQTTVKATATRAARKATPSKPRAPRIVADHVKGPKQERSRAENCSECGAALRPKRARAEEYPGTVRHHLGGKCWRCCNPPKRMGRPPRVAS